jgi:hypothetical protein
MVLDYVVVAAYTPISIPAGAKHWYGQDCLPYADNLNATGTDKRRVQAAKDGAVAQNRKGGFVVHEELDVTTRAQCLSFLIDIPVTLIRTSKKGQRRFMFSVRSDGFVKVQGQALRRFMGEVPICSTAETVPRLSHKYSCFLWKLETTRNLSGSFYNGLTQSKTVIASGN